MCRLDRDQQQRVLPEVQRWGHAERFGRAGQRLLLPQLQVDQNNDGHNYAGPIQMQSREFCKVKCQASRGQCKGWTVTGDGECYLKDSVGSMRSDSGVQVSGFC